MIPRKQKLLTVIMLIALGVAICLHPISAHADDNYDVCTDVSLSQQVLDAAGCNPAGNENGVPNLVITILNSIIAISSLVAIVYIVIGGIKYMSSNGERDRVESGKKTITYALIGMSVCVLAFAIVNFAVKTINGASPNVAYDSTSSGNSYDEAASISNGANIATNNDGLYIKLNTPATQLKEGEKMNLLARLKPKDTTLTWSSSDPSVISVDQEGRITANKPGKSTITAKAEDGTTASTEITVSEPIVAQSVTITPNSNVKVTKGKTISLQARVIPFNATNKTVKWSSNKKSVATVNKNGVVKGKKPGTAKITAKTSNGKKATIKVKVEENNSSTEVSQELLNGLKKYHQNIYTGPGYSINCRGSSPCVGCGSCGIAAYVAAIYTLTRKNIDYMDFVREGCDTGFFTTSGGSNFAIVLPAPQNRQDFYERKYGVKLGFLSKPTESDEEVFDKIVKELKKGNVVINYVTHPPSTLTTGDHYVTSIAYRQRNGEDEIYIWNPNSTPGHSKGDCDKGECWYTKSEYMRDALGGNVYSYVLRKTK